MNASVGLDQLIAQLATGIVVNGITSIAKVGVSRARMTHDRRLRRAIQAERPRILAILAAAEADSRTKGRLADVYSFLESADFAIWTRQLMATHVVSGGNTQVTANQLRDQLLTLLSLHLGMPASEAAGLCDSIFDGMGAAVSAAWQAVGSGEPFELSEEACLVLSDELAALPETSGFLSTLEPKSVSTLRAFERDLKAAIGVRHGWIQPQSIGGSRKIPLDDLYVAPDLIRSRHAGDEPRRPIPFAEFPQAILRTVVLGNPGGGKSTLTDKLAHDLAVDDGITSASPIPLVVVLRDYGAQRKKGRHSLLRHLESKCSVDYLLDPPTGSIEYFLRTGRALVIFDGLDELIETGDRRLVSSDVEVFAAKFPSTAILVTSREVGYAEAPLDPKRFETYHLAAFGPNKVSEYATKWFSADPDLTAAERKRKSSSFLVESERVPDLRSNPLMLSLMCSLYRGENFIPRNRPEVYQKCSTLLFESWDRQRDISVALPFQNRLRPAMMFLAFSLYKDPDLHGGVPESKLVSLSTEYLSERYYEDPDEAAAAAREFVEFCRGRPWVFTDVGTTPDGESLYQFTHRTFLEYFAAGYIVRKHSSTAALSSLLIPRIRKGEWDVVAQLAFQQWDSASEGAGEALLVEVLKAASSAEPDERTNLLSFVTRSLEFLVPQVALLRQITKAAVDWYVEIVATSADEGRRRRGRRDSPDAVITGLLTSADENEKRLAGAMQARVVDVIEAADKDRSVVAFRLAEELPTFVVYFSDSSRLSAVSAPWTVVSDNIFAATSDRLRQLAIERLDAAVIAMRRGAMGPKEVVARHGLEAFLTFSSGIAGGSALTYVNAMTWPMPDGPGSLPWAPRYLGEMSHLFLTERPPWVEKPSVPTGLLYEYDLIGGRRSARTLPRVPGADFVALTIFALASEVPEARERLRIRTGGSAHSIPRTARSLMTHRYEHADQVAPLDLSGVNLSRKEAAFLTKWANGKVNLAKSAESQVLIKQPSRRT